MRSKFVQVDIAVPFFQFHHQDRQYLSLQIAPKFWISILDLHFGLDFEHTVEINLKVTPYP